MYALCWVFFLCFFYGCHALYCCVAQTKCAAGAGERCDVVSVECQRFIPSLGRNDVSIRSFGVCFLSLGPFRQLRNVGPVDVGVT